LGGMEREFLEDQLAAGRSLEQIGVVVGKHAGTVWYWLRKHGLAAAHSDKFAPKHVSPDEFGRLVARGLTRAEIARELGISGSTVTYWLRKLGLRTHRASVIAENARARSAGVRTVRRCCRKHGSVPFHLAADGTYECPRCRSEAVVAHRRRVKRILVAEAGGRCRRCGYDEHPAALQFHHLDPATKAFNISAQGVTRSLVKVRAEAEKCVLLCGNCHALVEAGVATL
jgi:transcriptional regulator with XRE-family HTH domain